MCCHLTLVRQDFLILDVTSTSSRFHVLLLEHFAIAKTPYSTRHQTTELTAYATLVHQDACVRNFAVSAGDWKEKGY